MNSSAQLKDRELRLSVLFFLIILEMRSSAALECAACVCFLRKLWVSKKIHLKFVKLWEMKKLPKTVRKGVKPCDTRWNRESWEVCAMIDKIPKRSHKMLWLFFKIPKYSHKTLWLVFKIPKYSHKTLWLVFKNLKYSYKTLWLVISSWWYKIHCRFHCKFYLCILFSFSENLTRRIQIREENNLCQILFQINLQSLSQ